MKNFMISAYGCGPSNIPGRKSDHPSHHMLECNLIFQDLQVTLVCTPASIPPIVPFQIVLPIEGVNLSIEEVNMEPYES